ncbi:CsbD family protein [Erwinia sp. OLTSP20]|uniref:glycine zipper domain-containing protein n=1 Tax=unclassified Erwinia TaxID=2622719 RepID=UPI000C184423|nr:MULTISPECIES: DUF883 family protein [unclassified Erwinia]PIJ51851.1 CsbD family protein [Erwinia sp. OAMSP11]PIJ74439.1 CsbD family protein [Erwinia sp. OLSSP12]PIJ83728.1 CsbD family protein [Erwinia sp. OLCASP19]PIJ86771.1 CsbD family protein [Erwinia sp. OLMTSP26]PIJ88178.1 CsbD family protein [Erwinia sp. OLMDSP33]
MLSGKAKDKAEEYAGLAEEAYGEATDAPGHRLRGATRRYAAQASDAARDVTSNVREQVSDNPLSGLAIAAGIGIIFGYLLGRK